MNCSLESRFCTAIVLISALSQSTAHATAAVPRSRLITSTSIGSARLGMSVRALKRAFAGATVGSIEGPIYESTLEKNGHQILRFNTRGEQLDMGRAPRDSDIITALRTSDPLFKTARGIGPGSWLRNAEKVYGRPTLVFWSEGEEATFHTLSRKMLFEVQAPLDPKSEYKVAGIYTRAELESLSGKTHRYRSSTRITSVGCYSTPYWLAELQRPRTSRGPQANAFKPLLRVPREPKPGR